MQRPMITKDPSFGTLKRAQYNRRPGYVGLFGACGQIRFGEISISRLVCDKVRVANAP